MLFFLLLLAWQNMIVGLCCCYCYCCFCKFDTISLWVRWLADSTLRRKRGRKCTWAKTPINYYLVFDQISSIKRISTFLHVAQGLLQKMLPIQLIPRLIYLNWKKKNSRRQVIFYLQHPYILSRRHAMIINKTHQLDVFLIINATSQNWHSIQHTSSSKEY